MLKRKLGRFDLELSLVGFGGIGDFDNLDVALRDTQLLCHLPEVVEGGPRVRAAIEVLERDQENLSIRMEPRRPLVKGETHSG